MFNKENSCAVLSSRKHLTGTLGVARMVWEKHRVRSLIYDRAGHVGVL